MNTIINLGWRGVSHHLVESGQLAELRELIGSEPDRSFVIGVPGVFGGTVVTPFGRSLVNASGLSDEARIVESGLWDLLKSGQMSVNEHQPAMDVVHLAMSGTSQIDWITVMDQGNTTIGLVTPRVLLKTLPFTYVVEQAGIQWELVHLGLSRDLLRMVTAVELKIPDFHSEQVNETRPQQYECMDHGARHITDENPCPDDGQPAVPVNL